MNDQYKELFEKVLKRLDLVTIGVLAVLLLISGYMFQAEKSYTVPPVDPPQRRQFNVRLPDETRPDLEASNLKEYQHVLNVLTSPTREIEQDENAMRVIRNNMFEMKTAEQQDELREALNARLREAEALFRSNRAQDALPIVDEILRQDRNHRGAIDLRRQIQARLAAPGQ